MGGAICGILACIASSMLMCCAPKTVDQGSCKFTAASVLLLLAGIIQLIMGIIVIYVLMGTLNEVNKGSHCADRYSTCATDSSGASCKGGVCFKNDPHDITNSCKAQSDWDSCKAKVAINLAGHPARSYNMFYTTGDTLPALAEPK